MDSVWQHTSVPVYQRISSFYKLTRARMYIVLENCWYAGTLVQWLDNRGRDAHVPSG